MLEQFDKTEKRLNHFITIDGLKRDTLMQILDTTETFQVASDRQVRKFPTLRGKTIFNLFFESSTRTLTTFELAAKRLSADVVNLNLNHSSTKKGESLLDTMRTLEAMHCDMFIVRHHDSGAAHFFASHVRDGVAVLNAGDGQHAHPTQAMLDCYTIRKHKPDLENLRILIVGDILHSRVARSQIMALNTLGVRSISVLSPPTLLPSGISALGVDVETNLDEAVKDKDVIIMLRVQNERMKDVHLPSLDEYHRQYGLTVQRLRQAKPDCIVMHPGPMNRGVEIESAVADGPQSVILEQVSNGVAVRMAILSMILGQ